MPRIALFSLLFSPLIAGAQLMSDQDARDQMKYDVQYLASDLLEGREAGTKGERMAADYIVQKFGSIGLMPYGDSTTYLQKFNFAAPPKAGDKCHLQLGRIILKQGEDYYPIDLSATAQVRGKVLKCGYGIAAPELGYNDFEGLQLRIAAPRSPSVRRTASIRIRSTSPIMICVGASRRPLSSVRSR